MFTAKQSVESYMNLCGFEKQANPKYKKRSKLNKMMLKIFLSKKEYIIILKSDEPEFLWKHKDTDKII